MLRYAAARCRADIDAAATMLPPARCRCAASMLRCHAMLLLPRGAALSMPAAAAADAPHTIRCRHCHDAMLIARDMPMRRYACFQRCYAAAIIDAYEMLIFRAAAPLCFRRYFAADIAIHA